MALLSFTATDFRCFERVSLEPDPRFNLVYGANASGKTSLLEAMAYLGRAKSFRGAATDALLRHGASEFLLLGRVSAGRRQAALGLRNGQGGLEVSIDGDRQAGAAALAELLPVQVMDPDVHNLVAGGPEERRRYLDGIAFHVEQGFLEAWRRFRRALRQRNAVLRGQGTAAELASWDREFAETGEALHAARGSVLEQAAPAMEAWAARLLGEGVGFAYRRGWDADRSLAEALAAGAHRDRAQGVSGSGPHRADLRLTWESRRARKLVSRGQQKLLAAALVLAATEAVQGVLQRPLLLLLDDPAAELDRAALGRLMSGVTDLGCQVVATSLDPARDLFPAPPALFHVERGGLARVE